MCSTIYLIDGETEDKGMPKVEQSGDRSQKEGRYAIWDVGGNFIA